MENEKLIDEIQKQTHQIMNTLQKIDLLISALHGIRNDVSKQWDELVLLKYKVTENK